MSDRRVRSSGWIPTDLCLTSLEPTVEWRDLSGVVPAEPFFRQTVARLGASDPAGRVHTGIDALLEWGVRERHARPAGIIGHVSRCGSTLLANALKTASDCVVLSEPQPLTEVLRPRFPHDLSFEHRAALLRSLAAAWSE